MLKSFHVYSFGYNIVCYGCIIDRLRKENVKDELQKKKTDQKIKYCKFVQIVI